MPTMISHIKKYTLFFVAIFNITALVLLYLSGVYEKTRPFESDTYDAVGWWFGAGSVLLWAVYAILIGVAKLRKTSK